MYTKPVHNLSPAPRVKLLTTRMWRDGTTYLTGCVGQSFQLKTPFRDSVRSILCDISPTQMDWVSNKLSFRWEKMEQSRLFLSASCCCQFEKLHVRLSCKEKAKCVHSRPDCGSPIQNEFLFLLTPTWAGVDENLQLIIQGGAKCQLKNSISWC